MAKTKIGKVKILLKGEYNADTQYIRLDGVTYNGSFYICKQDCQGINVDNQEYWQLAAEKGDKPINGVDYNTEEEKAEFKKEIISEGKTQLDEYNVTKKAELDAKEVELEGALTNKKDELIIDIDDTLNGFEDNVEQKVADFNTNASEKTASFNQNAQTQTSAFDSNAETQTEKFNTNATSKTNGFDTNATEKTTSFDTNATEKTTAFDTNATSKTNEYNSNATQLTTQTDDLFDALTTNEINGTEIYIDDAKACRVINAEISGMYKQETTSGTNLMNLNVVQDSKITVNEDGTITINGTGGFNLAFESFTFKANIPYYIKWEIVSGTVIQTNNSIFRTPDNLAWAQKDKFTSFSVAEDKTLGNVWIHKDANFENAKIRIWISESQSDFEPYTGVIASPNPDYPQAIEQVDSMKLQCTGSNLLDYTKILSTPSTTSGITIKLEANGNITISGKPKYSYFSVIQSKNIIDILKDGETYYLDQSNYNRYFYTEIQAVKADGSITYIGPQKSYASFKVNKSLFKKYVIRIIGGNLTNWGEEERTVTSNFKLTRQKNLPFEKYIEKTVNIDLKGNKLCAISDTIKDKLLIDKNGNVALQKNVNYSTFYAFTTVNGSFSDRTQFILTLVNCVKSVEQNSFSAISNCMLKNTVDSGMGYYGTTTSGSVRITVLNSLLNVTQEDTTSTKLNAAKTFLQNLSQTPEIYYPAEVPELIDLGQLPELPKTFNGINNIWAETNLGNTKIEIEYVQDVKKLIENLQALALDNATTE